MVSQKKKLQIPTELKKTTFDFQLALAKVDLDIPSTISPRSIALVDAYIENIADMINKHITERVYALQTILEDLVTNREKRASSFNGSQDLHKVLFGDIIEFMRKDYEGFVKYTTRYLSWDPIGKIVDDQSAYYEMEFRSPFKEFEDMVDVEMHTYLVMGSKVSGELRSVSAIAYPPHDKLAFEKRNELILGSIINIEKSLKNDRQAARKTLLNRS